MIKRIPIDISDTAQARLSRASIIAYGLPSIPLSLGWIMLMMYVPTYYGVSIGIGLGLTGIIIACSRLFDIASDMVIGWLSDKTRDSFLNRKLWVAVGLPVFCIATAILLSPPEGASAVYLTGAILFYFFGYTLTEIPFSAIGLEISQRSDQRSTLAASKYGFLILGGMIGAALPLLWGGNSAEAFPYIIKIIAISSLIILPLFLYFVPKKQATTIAVKSPSYADKTLRNPLRLLRQHTQIRRVIILFFILTLANCYGSTLSLLYVTHIIEAPSKLGLLWLCSGVGIMVGLPLWTYFSKKYGKIKSWRFAILLSAFALVPFLFFQSGDVAIMAIFSFLGGLVGACDTIMCISILADMVAKEEKKGAKVFAGSLAALRYTVSKLAYAVPLLLAFPILEALNLSKTTDASIIQSSVLISLYAGVPILCRIGAYFYIRSWGK